MRIKPYDIKKVAVSKYQKSENYRVITEFKESDMSCAKVEEFPQKNADICASCLNNSARHYHIGGVKAIVRIGDVYLIRTKEGN